jgi:hypothetical protein
MTDKLMWKTYSSWILTIWLWYQDCAISHLWTFVKFERQKQSDKDFGLKGDFWKIRNVSTKMLVSGSRADDSKHTMLYIWFGLIANQHTPLKFHDAIPLIYVFALFLLHPHFLFTGFIMIVYKYYFNYVISKMIYVLNVQWLYIFKFYNH